jgi:DNA repair protein RecN (Recombination protein N)
VLHELRIENLLLIEQAELRFGEGLNAITGETGAGKTILAHSIDLLMGGRARPQIVRPGAEEAYVEGVFTPPDGLLEDPELREIASRLPERSTEIVLGRRVGVSGRTSAFVQGRSASAPDLRALGGRTLAFFGQHEHRRLTLSSAQLEILDSFAGEDHLDRRRGYRREHAELTRLEEELAALREREGARERDLDLLQFELEEIEAAGPEEGEERELGTERERLRHAKQLRSAAAGAHAALAGEEDAGGAAELLAEAESALSGAAGVDEDLDALRERAGGLALELRELAREVRAYADGVEAEPGRLQEVEERLDAVDRLKRKHGGTVEAVLAHAERCRSEIARLEQAGERSSEIDDRIAALRERRDGLGKELSSARNRAARELETRVADELAALAMEGAALEVSLEPHSDGHGPSGRETVTFLVATNPGLPVSPLRDAASGGELSRVMLALTGLGPEAGARTLVFDEIDAGIGGSTARAAGERLRRLGEERQVICITHLPQIASLASAHFRIEKRAEEGETRASVQRVDGDELVAEICRMLGADRDDEVASRHAREMLAAA